MLSFEDFERLSSEYNAIPMARVLLADIHTPVSAYLALRQNGIPSFLFESVEPNEKIGRFSFIGSTPTMMVTSSGGVVTVHTGGRAEILAETIPEALDRLSRAFRQAPIEGLQGLPGGFVGYMGYDVVRDLENIPLPEEAAGMEDDARFGLFPSIVHFDHRAQVMTIVHNVLIDPARPLREQYDEGKKVVDVLELQLRRSVVPTSSFRCAPDGVEDAADRERYCDAVRRAKEHIREGDIFQVVLSRRVFRKFVGDPFPLYRALRMINPSPYLFFLDFGETRLIGSSPEVLVRARGGIVEVLPIAGTRKRGRDQAEDKVLEQELLEDHKELAEHVMLVDLGRNDVGRISEYGTVEVPVFKRVERYSHVMHLVSEVRGRLRSSASAVEVLTACFPAGTVSGAPKVRAMEIISELEGTRRGAYAGAVGYVGLDGSLDTCIAIRTIIAHGTTLKIQAGAGIVADSVPEREYEETASKSRALLQAVEVASRGLSSSAFEPSAMELPR
jgi:anthranilate synthase component 1